MEWARAARASRTTEIVRISERIRGREDVIAFTIGKPAPETVPIEWLREVTKEVVDSYGVYLWEYSSTQGDICDTIVNLLKDDGFEIDESNVIILTGALHGGNLVTRAFIDPGDMLALALPTYPINLQNFVMQTDNLLPLPLDDDGMVVEELERKLKAGARPKVVYVIPDFQNPTGVTLSLERRKRLVELADEYDFIVFEDTPYRYMRYEGETLPSLYQLNPERVVHVNSFSKTVSTSIRVGYAVARPDIIQKFVSIRQATDYATPLLNQMIIKHFIEKGYWKPQLERLNSIHGKRLKAFMEALEEHMPDEVKWTHPKGGTFIWLSLPDRIDMKSLLDRALSHGTAFIPSSDFYPEWMSSEVPKAMRLNFPYYPEDKAIEGVKRLADAIKEELA